MKSIKMLNVLALFLFILGIIGLVTTFSFTKEYKIKIAYLEQQNKSLMEKLVNFQSNLEDFRISLDTFKGDNAASMKDVSVKMTALETDKTEIISKIAALAKDIQDLQKNYSASISELKAKVENFNATLSAAALQSNTKVDLGQISVEKPKR